MAGWLVGYGADVRVLDPPEVREAVIQRLKEIAARHDARPAALAGCAGVTPRRRAAPAPRDRRPTGWPGCSTWCRTCWPGPGIELAEAAADLGVTERQLREDLELLWVCGLPGYGPGDLIDMAFDGDRVTITYDAGIDRPLRLTPDEALALVVALRMLAETPGRGQPRRGRPGPRQDRAAPPATWPTRRSRSGCPATPTGSSALRGAVRAAARAADHLLHRDPGRDHRAGRRPDAGAVVGGRAYLEAWCRRAEAVRLFRVDRIDALDRAGRAGRAAAAGAARRRRARACSSPTRDLPLVTLRVGRGARWITEYYPCEEVGARPTAEEWLVSLRVTDLDWARRLVLGLGPEVTVVAPPELAEASATRPRPRWTAYAHADRLAPRVRPRRFGGRLDARVVPDRALTVGQRGSPSGRPAAVAGGGAPA